MPTLKELWERRSQLTNAEWEQLYQLVFSVLKRSRGACPELGSLPSDIKHYIDCFFCDKVFLPTTKPTFEDNELHAKHALIVFFSRYLRDHLDDPYLKRALPLEDESNDNDSDEHFQTAYTPDELIRFQTTDTPNELMLLREVGLDSKQVTESARKFIKKSEKWVRLYLALHTCPNKEDRLPLKHLAENYQIPAYHSRARQLGITRKKGEFEQGYEKTLIGQWLVSMNISLNKENQQLIEAAFKILCWEALSIYKKKPAPKH